MKYFLLLEAVAKLPLPGKSMILPPIARAGLPARSVPARDISGEKASRNRCNGRQKRGFTAAGSFAIASLISLSACSMYSKNDPLEERSNYLKAVEYHVSSGY